jgi:hypothetical protein
VAAHYFETFTFAVVSVATNHSTIFVATYLWLKSCEILGQYFGLTKIQILQCLHEYEFRLQYAYEYEGEIMPNRAVLNTLLDCKRLERIVLYEEDGPNIPWKSQELQDVLLKFVSSMPNLVCFCFITASEIEPGTVTELKKKFDELIVPTRPAFWYHVDQSLPRATDPTVPRIHYDQIVSPINYLEMSPEF